MTASNPPLKVGFDLDGVLLYNPARIVRPLIALFKENVLHKHKTRFYIPSTKVEIFFWRLFHKSSIFIAPGYKDLIRIVKEGKIEAYLITARFNFLKRDLDAWLKKMHANDVFKAVYYNEQNEQPHLYKERLIKKLKLDAFIDDNWDIVQHLQSLKEKKEHQTNTYWIYNIFDRKINYAGKFPGIKNFIEYIESTINLK